MAAGDDIQITISLMIDLDFMGTSLVNVAEISQSSNVLDMMDIDSDADMTNDNDPGGNPLTPSDDVIDGDGTGMPGDTVAITDEDDSDPAIIMIVDPCILVCPPNITITVDPELWCRYRQCDCSYSNRRLFGCCGVDLSVK